LQLPWPEAFKLLEMAYLFEVPLKELHVILQSENRVREISTRFNKCWEGLKAFQKHRGVERTGHLTLRLYAEVQKHHSEVIVFDRECSPVVLRGGGRWEPDQDSQKSGKVEARVRRGYNAKKKGRRASGVGLILS
jgi:hypothetical protein